MQRSAVPMATKRAALVNETVRRLRNCHESVEESEVAEILSRFGQKLKTSGYCNNEKFRRQVIDAGVKVHREQIRVEATGGPKSKKNRMNKQGLKRLVFVHMQKNQSISYVRGNYHID